MKNKQLGGMPTPKRRLEFEHNICLTLEEIQYKISNNIKDPGLFHILGPALKKLQELPNRRIDLATVDNKLRLHSNMNKWQELIGPQILKNMEKKDLENTKE